METMAPMKKTKAMKVMKAVMKAVMKHDDKNTGGAGGVLKKPAAKAKPSIRNIAASLMQSDEPVEQTRDRNKSHQWSKYFAELPDAIQDAYNKSGRAQKTNMVNKLVVQDPDGGYSINTDSNIYKDTMKKYEEKYGEAGEKGMIKSHMITMCGGIESLAS